MSYTLSKDELRKPDYLTALGQRILVEVIKNSKLVIGIVGLILLGGLAYLISNKVTENKELALQEEYYAFEKTYLKKKEAFAKGETEAKSPEQKKKGEKEDSTVDGVVAQKASGDIVKDYGFEVEGWKKLIAEQPQSKAGAMAALELSNLYISYKNKPEALQVLAKIKPAQKPNSLLGALVFYSYANLLSDQNQCTEAISVWDSLLAKGNPTFAVEASRYGQALCYATLGQSEKAESLLNAILTEKPKLEPGAPEGANAPQTPTQMAAKKYLRFLSIKKQMGSAKSVE